MRGKSALVVDDSAFLRQDIAERFKEFGFFKVDVASDGEEALKKIQNNDYDIISLDIIMPNMHGLECLAEIRKSHPSTPVLVVTSLGAEPRAVEKLEEQLDDKCKLVSKYLLKDTLEESVEGLLSNFDRKTSDSESELEEHPIAG